jgi:hypothetical protein
VATDSEKLILSISADVTAVKRALAKMSTDTTTTTDGMVRDFKKVDLAVKYFAANTNKVGAAMRDTTRQTQAATVNLTAQMNDIAQQFQAGTSMYTIMAQQGSQVTQALQAAGGGMLGFAKTIGGALMGMLSPMNLVSMGLIAVTGVAVSYFKEWMEGGELSEKEMKKQVDTLYQIADAYGDLLPAVKKFAEARREADAAADRKQSTELAIAEDYKKLQPIIDKLTASVNDFNAEVARGSTSPQAKAGIESYIQNVNELVTAFQTHTLTVEDVQQVYDSLNDSYLSNTDAAAGLRTQLNELMLVARAQAEADAKAREEASEINIERKKAAEDYKKAMKEMQGISKSTATEVEHIWQVFIEMINKARTEAEKLRAEIERDYALGRLNTESLGNLARAQVSNDMDEYTRLVMGAESGGDANAQNAVSTASGQFQFLDSTFKKYIPYLQSLPEFAGLTAQQIMAQKNNIAVQKAAFEKFTQDNVEYLDKHNIEVNNATKYMAHVLGASGARQLMTAAPGTSVSSIFGAKAAGDNPSLLGDRTVEQSIAAFYKKMRTEEATITTKASQQRVDDARQDAEIQGKITDAYDEQAAAEAQKLKYAELRRNLERDMEEKGRVPTAEQYKEIEAIAKKHGETVGREEGTKAAEKEAEAKKKADEQSAKTFEGAMRRWKEETDSINAQEEAIGNLGKNIDETTRKRETAQAEQAILAAAARDGTAATKEEAAAAKEVAAAYGLAQGKKEGFRLATKGAETSESTFESAIRKWKEETDSINAQEQAIGNLGDAIDEVTRKREEAQALTAILAAAARDGTAATEEEAAAAREVAAAYGLAQGAKEGFKDKTKEMSTEQKEFFTFVADTAKTALGGFINDLREGVDAGEAFSNMLDRIVDSLINMAIETLFSKEILGTLLGGLGGIGGGIAAPGAAAGGTVGMASHGDGRSFAPSTWAGARRYAKGGMAGLRPGEVPIIAHKGEVIIPRDIVDRNRGKVVNMLEELYLRKGWSDAPKFATGGVVMSSPGVNMPTPAAGSNAVVGSTIDNSVHQQNSMTIDMAQTGAVAASNEDAKIFALRIQKLVQLEMVRESRPGGLLRTGRT